MEQYQTMNKVTTIFCAVAFMISGIMLATANDSSSDTGYKTIAAAVPIQRYAPALPQDLLLDLAKMKSSDTSEVTTDSVNSELVDSLKQRISDLEEKGQVTKVKWRRAPAPAPVVVRDTIRETHYYLAKQVGNKEGPNGECIPVYEVHKVGEVCPEISNSSTEDDDD